MPRVAWPSIGVDCLWVIAIKLDQLLCAVVAILAEALELTEPEVVPATAVVANVVDDLGGPEDAALARQSRQ